MHRRRNQTHHLLLMKKIILIKIYLNNFHVAHIYILKMRDMIETNLFVSPLGKGQMARVGMHACMVQRLKNLNNSGLMEIRK